MAIERGRYWKVNKEDRVWKLCNDNSVEDEQHFLSNCKAYDKERKDFLVYISKQFQNFDILNDNQQFVWLLSCEDEIVCNALFVFVYRCFDIGKTKLFSHV